MSFDLDQAQQEAARRLRRRLDADVAAARRRIRAYTLTEMEEVAAGTRPTENQAQIDRFMEVSAKAMFSVQEFAEAMKRAVGGDGR